MLAAHRPQTISDGSTRGQRGRTPSSVSGRYPISEGWTALHNERRLDNK